MSSRARSNNFCQPTNQPTNCAICVFQCFPPKVPYLLSFNTHFPLSLPKLSYILIFLPHSFFLCFPVCLNWFSTFSAETQQEEVVPSFSSLLFLFSALLSLLPPSLHPLCCWLNNRLSQVFNVFSESAGCPSRATDLLVACWQAGK